MKVLRSLFIAAFLITAIYHLVGIISPELTEPSPAWRHALFGLISLIGAYLFYQSNPRWLLVFIPLIIQQLWSHGIYGWMVWQEQDRIDWASVVVCLSMPVLAFYLYQKNRSV